jgi:hypothetical protein
LEFDDRGSCGARMPRNVWDACAVPQLYVKERQRKGKHASPAAHAPLCPPFICQRRWDGGVDLIRAFVIDLVASDGTTLQRYDFSKLGAAAQSYTFGERGERARGWVPAAPACRLWPSRSHKRAPRRARRLLRRQRCRPVHAGGL